MIITIDKDVVMIKLVDCIDELIKRYAISNQGNHPDYIIIDGYLYRLLKKQESESSPLSDDLYGKQMFKGIQLIISEVFGKVDITDNHHTIKAIANQGYSIVTNLDVHIIANLSSA